MSERVEMAALYPSLPGEDASTYTARVLSHSREHQVNRQCSIGYHGECSDRAGESCRCLCHDDATRWFSVEGHPEGEGQVITKVGVGKQHWPPVPGEPEGTWAVWLMANGSDDATARAKALQKALAPEPVKPDPTVVLAEKVAELALLAAGSRAEIKAGIISAEEYSKRRQWMEADLTEVWREYVHSLS